MEIDSAPKPGKLDLISHIARFRLSELKKGHSYLAIIVLMISGIFFSQDIYVDIFVEGKDLAHITVEGSIFLAVLLALAIEVNQVIALHTSITLSQQEIRRLKSHLAQVMADEFDRWKLTATEKEIAILLIKGLSMREIADARQVKEKSVRQQAAGLYPKAGVTNRNELAAHFIEDLLIPDLR